MSLRRTLPWLAGGAALLLAQTTAAQAPPIRAQKKPPTLKVPSRPALKKPAAPAKPGATSTRSGTTTTRPSPAGDKDPPGAAGRLPQTMDKIARAVDTPYRPKPGGHRVKFNLQDADLAELVNHISGMTGKRFIYGAKVRQIKATVVSPAPVTLAEAYEAFLSILEANGMTVVPHGRFLKIVDSGGVVSQGTPIYSRGAPVPDTDRFITRLYRLKHVSASEVSQLLTKFKSKEGDISVHDPGSLLILTDTGSNVRRMIRIIEEIDVGGAGSKMWIEPVHYGSATDVAKQINDIFELGKEGGNSAGLVKVVADENTNSLVIVGTEDSYMKLLEFLRRVDTKPSAEGRVHVLPLQHAVADELAQVLSQMLSGAAPQARGRGRGNQPAQAGAGNAAGMFESEVRVTADPATNALVITSSARDYAQLRVVIDKLDAPRRQVFIEAVIMDVSVNRTNQFGLAYHGGATADLGGGDDTIIFGGLDPLTSIAPGPDQLQGLALGVRGPELDGTTNLLGTGLSIPAFGVVLNALASSSDANVLSTPHIIATDNVAAEINVGENIPLQENFAGLGGGNLAGLAGAAQGQQGGFNPGLLGALGGFGFNAPRQDVGTKVKVTPHINDSNQVRLEIEEEISERGASSGALGAVSITQRNANTTVIVEDQQTIVIGGLMRDALVKSKRKVPVLGDLPVLGFLFRSTTTETRKTNLLLILTPYIIREQADLRRIFQRKMQERQEFLDRYFVFGSPDWEPPRDYRRTNGLVENIRQTYLEMAEQAKLTEALQPKEELRHEPSDAIELPQTISSPGKSTKPKPAPKRTAPKRRPRIRRPTPRIRRKRSEVESPIRINPMQRSVSRVE